MEKIKNEDISLLFLGDNFKEAEKFLSEQSNWDKVNRKIAYLHKNIDRSLKNLGKTWNDLEKRIYGDKNKGLKENESEKNMETAKKISDENKDEISQLESSVFSDNGKNNEICVSFNCCAYLVCKCTIVALTQIMVLRNEIESAWKDKSDPIAKAFFEKHHISNKNEINDIVEKNSGLIALLNPEFRKIVMENFRFDHNFVAVFSDIIGSDPETKKPLDVNSIVKLDARLIVEIVNNEDAFNFYRKVLERAAKIFPDKTKRDVKIFQLGLELLEKNTQIAKNISVVIKYIFVFSTIGLVAGIPFVSIFMLIPTPIFIFLTVCAFCVSTKFKDQIKSVKRLEKPTMEIQKEQEKITIT